MLKDLKQKDQTWEAKIYAAKRQKWYDAVITPPKGNELEIEISVGFLSKTIEWRKI